MAHTDLVDSPTHPSCPGVSPFIEIRRVTDEAGWYHARTLILEYLEWVRAATGFVPLTVQPWLRDELGHLDAWYTPPRGTLLLAILDLRPVGVVGVEVQPEGWAEMKRFYVSPGARGHGLGERLVVEAMFAAADLGCQTLRLESLPGPMDHAITLYRRLGFRPAARIGHTAVDNVLSLECSVGRAAAPGA
jgi:GNAT superfamily N-acetyltransferase